MNFEQFDPATLPTGSKTRLYLEVARLPGGDVLRLPTLVAKGSAPGPTIAVLGGVHGDEYEGPQAIREVFASLEPDTMKGTFIGIPQTNPPAFASGTRDSPLDGLNLARVFPGRNDGSPTERIAHCVTEYVIDRCDFLIDLHSSGARWTSPCLVGYYLNDSDLGRRSRDAALAFGAPVIWGHPELAPGRSLNEAAARNIPWLYTESPGGGWLNRENAGLYARGVMNVMKHMGILPGEIEAVQPQYRLWGTGAIEDSVVAHESGYMVVEVQPLDRVRALDVLGRIFGLAGELLEEVRSPSDGVIVYIRAIPTTTVGDLAFLVTQEEQA